VVTYDYIILAEIELDVEFLAGGASSISGAVVSFVEEKDPQRLSLSCLEKFDEGVAGFWK
jgi:hypothetical protein